MNNESIKPGYFRNRKLEKLTEGDMRMIIGMLEFFINQYEQVCADNHVMGWPDLVKSTRRIIDHILRKAQ